MKKSILLACLLTTIIAIPTWAQKQFQYKIYEAKTGDTLSIDQLVGKIQNADIVLFGEQHDDTVAHVLQYQVLRGLHKAKNGAVTLSMEMWQRDVQPIMDEYLAGFISEKNFKTESRAWNNYIDYKPMVDFALKHKLKVVCANTPARYTNMVTRGTLAALNKLPKATQKAYLPPFPIDTLTGRYYEKFLDIMGGHTMPGMYIYQSQNIWDASMTYAILEARKQMPKNMVLHLNGRFHSDEYLGVTYRLLNASGKQQNVRTITCIEEDVYDQQTHQKLADYVIISGKKPAKKDN